MYTSCNANAPFSCDHKQFAAICANLKMLDRVLTLAHPSSRLPRPSLLPSCSLKGSSWWGCLQSIHSRLQGSDPVEQDLDLVWQVCCWCSCWNYLPRGCDAAVATCRSPAALLPAPGTGRIGLTSTIVWRGLTWRRWWCRASRWESRRRRRDTGPKNNLTCIGCRCWCRPQFVDLGRETLQCLWILAKQVSELVHVLIHSCFLCVEVHRPLHLVLRSAIVPHLHPSTVPFGIIGVALRLPLPAGQASNVTMTSSRISENSLCFLCPARHRVLAVSTCSHGCSSIH